MRQHYKTLEVNENSTKEEIKASYRRLSKLWHPDKNQDPEKEEEFNKKHSSISEAYEVIGNPEKRPIYDEYGIGCSLDEIEAKAHIKVYEVFQSVLKINFKKHILFQTAQETIKILIEKKETVKSNSERKILELESKISLLKNVAKDKIKEPMEHFKKAISKEIEGIEANRSEEEKVIKNIDLDLAIHKRAYDILKSDYPGEEMHESRGLSAGQRFEQAPGGGYGEW